MIDKPEDGTGSNTELTQKYARAKVQMTNLCPHIHIQTAVTNSLLLYCVINGSDCTFYLYLYLKTTICVCFDSRQNHTCYKCITLVLVSHTQAHMHTAGLIVELSVVPYLGYFIFSPPFLWAKCPNMKGS